MRGERTLIEVSVVMTVEISKQMNWKELRCNLNDAIRITPGARIMGMRTGKLPDPLNPENEHGET
jgi:hypothetical protein